MLSNIHSKEINYLYQTPIVQQTAFWSKVKQHLGEGTIAVNFKFSNVSSAVDTVSQQITSDILVLIKPAGRHHTIAYVPYGPELEPDEELQAPFLEELSECLRSYLPNNCIMIRYDLCWESWWAKNEHDYDETGNWRGEPSLDSRELRFNINTINGNFRKASHNILPSNTIYLDLKPTTEDIINRMKPKTRYNIGVSRRKGVVVKKAGIENIETWYKLYCETAERNNLFVNELKYFEAVLLARSDNSESPANVKLLIAESDHQPLAAMFLIVAKDRGSYLYGASSNSNRNLMATYALQWEAIKISKSMGCVEYDMFGISPNAEPSHPLYGLYKFKSGFGGNTFHSMGAWDYPLLTEEYSDYRNAEFSRQGFHLS